LDLNGLGQSQKFGSSVPVIKRSSIESCLDGWALSDIHLCVFNAFSAPTTQRSETVMISIFWALAHKIQKGDFIRSTEGEISKTRVLQQLAPS